MNKEIDSIREVMGTLPSMRPTKVTNVLQYMDALDVSVEAYTNNPYKAMFVSATSTWGDDNFKSKWADTSIEGKLNVIKAVLTHNTLPQAKEVVHFTIRVNRVPRWLFDYHAQNVKFISFMSIGCRDNNKLDASIIKINSEGDTLNVYKRLKDYYEQCLDAELSTWQSARAFLPQNYSHAYHFGQNLLSIVSSHSFHGKVPWSLKYKDLALMRLYQEVQTKIGEIFPIIGTYLDCMFTQSTESINKLTVDDITETDLHFFNLK